MDVETAEPDSSRRGLIGAIGAAGLASAAALAVARPAAAAPFTTTTEDRALLDQVMLIELTARDLYAATAAAGTADDILDVVEVLRFNHGAYAQAIAGSTGTPADGRDDNLFDELESSFTGDDTQAFADAARDLENSLVTTHTELLSQYESIDAILLTGSIVVVEARHATVLADVGGLGDDLDELFDPQADPLALTGNEP